MSGLRPEECPTCKAAGRRGYCAPLRCYCEHDACPAVWSPRPAPPDVTAISMRGRKENSDWADRPEGSSWIDGL